MSAVTGTPALPGHLADNVVHFTRLLRTAGVPVGTDRALLALEALKVAGIESRADFHAVLASCLVSRAEHRALFEQAFQIFWRDPDLLGQMLRLLLPRAQQKPGVTPPAENRRLAEALFPTPPAGLQPAATRERVDLDVQLSWSERERLRKADFDTMTPAEWAAARRVLVELDPFFRKIVTRRYRPRTGATRLDLRALLRRAARRGGDIAELPRRGRRTRPETLVAIVDISGSMSRYSRMFLHFLHAVTNASHRVSAFVFGTRLTHITRQLRAGDPDVAIDAVVKAVDDWSGGTRIGGCLQEFNVRWARRTCGSGATVLLVTDGLEHGDPEPLARQTERLAKSCRRLVWLNPLLRYDGFEPRARGVCAMLPHADLFLPVHNIDSLARLARALADGAIRGTLAWK